MADASTESLILDDINLNDGAPWTILLEPAFTFTPAKKKLTWATSSQSDGSAPSGGEDHFENAEMTFSMIMAQQVDSDTARATASALTKKLQEATKTFGGLPLQWTPSNSVTPLTFYVVQAEHDEFPTARTDAYFSTGPEINVHLYLRPFGYVGEQLAEWSYSEPFLWDSISGGRWKFDTPAPPAAPTVVVGLGSLIATTTALKELYLPWTTFGSTTALRFEVGADISGSAGTSLFAKRQDANSYMRVGASPSGSALRIVKKDSGDTIVATTPFTFSPSTLYWITMTVDGDDISGALYADGDNPLDGAPVALATVNYTLTGGEVTKFGASSRGNLGIRIQPGATTAGWLVDHFDARGMTQVRSAEPVLGLEIRDVPGHVSAEGRLVLTEASTTPKTWRHVEFGRESKDYDPKLGWPYLLDSDVLDTSFAGKQVVDYPGTYNPDGAGTASAIVAVLSQTTAVTVCGTGGLQHLGTFKVKARVGGDPGTVVRFKRQIGDGSFEENLWSDPLPDGDFHEIDLGTITIKRQNSAGLQTWQGRLDAMNPDKPAAAIVVDYLMMIPVEAYGKARAPLQPLDASVFAAFDHFIQATGNLDTKGMDSGNHWATSGQAGDFVVAPPLGSPPSGNYAGRSTISLSDVSNGRYGMIKKVDSTALNLTNVQMQADVRVYISPGTGQDLTDKIRYGIFIRCPVVSANADPNNWLMAVLQTTSAPVGFGPNPGGAPFTHSVKLMVIKRVAGVTANLAIVNTRHAPDEKLTVALTADTTGLWQAYVWPAGTKQPGKPLRSGQDNALATGALSTGGAGIYDGSTLSSSGSFGTSNALLGRAFDNVVLFGATPDAVCFPTFTSGGVTYPKQVEIRSDATRRTASGTSTAVGEVPRYQGKRFFLESAGDAGRINRVFVKWRETDVDEVSDLVVADAAIVQAYVTPRYLYPPGTGT